MITLCHLSASYQMKEASKSQTSGLWQRYGFRYFNELIATYTTHRIELPQIEGETLLGERAGKYRQKYRQYLLAPC